jgi:hypothetical protein
MMSMPGAGFSNYNDVDDSTVSNGIQNLHLNPTGTPFVSDGSTGMARNGQTNRTGVRREGPRALQRRSQVMLSVADGESTIPSPSSEMIANMSENSGAGPSEPRGNKRLHAELTPLSEEMSDDRSPLGQLNSPRKKGKPGESAAPANSKPSRSKGKGVAGPPPRSGRNRATTSINTGGGESSVEQRPRRSTRQAPQKRG